ncbi:cyanase [Edaphobacter flagellatus]|uniref:cyanase n=1 Tax=Edaphobacter flagellatus TaxID=1933044 RepID=UPI0021B22534|nr:cyanase [Edaphobacter flagellatus]
MITRQEATQRILEAKQEKQLTFREIANDVGMHPVFVTATLLGQGTFHAEQSERLIKMLDLGEDVAIALQQIPSKGSLSAPVPVDPLLYRFHEINQIYGTTIKALIHEMFGDGIMSAIDFTMDIERISDSAGDRVKITYNGKFLPYKRW